jgi:hypothetical protein
MSRKRVCGSFIWRLIAKDTVQGNRVLGCGDGRERRDDDALQVGTALSLAQLVKKYVTSVQLWWVVGAADDLAVFGLDTFLYRQTFIRTLPTKSTARGNRLTVRTLDTNFGVLGCYNSAMADDRSNTATAAPPNLEGTATMQTEKVEHNGAPIEGEQNVTALNSRKRAQPQGEENGSGGAMKRVKGVAPIKPESVPPHQTPKKSILTIAGIYCIPMATSRQKQWLALEMTMPPKLQMTATIKWTLATRGTRAAVRASRAGKTRRMRRSKKARTKAANLGVLVTPSSSATHVPSPMSSLLGNAPLAIAADWSTTCAST